MEKLIHQDDLDKYLSRYKYFGDEENRLVQAELFKSLFIYKYGGFLSNWSIYISDGKIRLESIGGMNYSFKLYER